jgi:hemoglobin
MITTPYERMGGEETVLKLVNRFYDLMDSIPEVQELRDIHSADLKIAREKLFEFLSGWLGGPQLYVEKYGHPRLRQRHLPFSIGTKERDQWLHCMFKAMQDIDLDDSLQKELQQSFFKTADFMRNQGI